MTALQLPTAHRPQLFSDLVGQDSAVKLLTSGIVKGNLGPVVLCSGPRGSGKTSSARLIAKALNCRNRTADSAEPCGTCNSCRRLSEPDPQWSSFIELDAGRVGGVDSIRDLADRFNEPVIEGTTRVAVIDEVHGLTGQAATAALKLLEEPPIGTFIVLATTHPHKLLPTIRSRCQEIRFQALSAPDVEKALVRVESGVSSEIISQIAAAVDGDLRRALNLLQSAQSGLSGDQLLYGDAGSDRLAADLLHQLSVSDVPMAIDRVKLLVANGNDAIGAQRAVAQISNQLWALSGLHADPKASASQLGVSLPAMKKLKEAAAMTDAAQVSRWMQQLSASWSMVSSGLMRPEAAVGMAVIQLLQANKAPAPQPKAVAAPAAAATPQPQDSDAADRWAAIRDELETSLLTQLEKCDVALAGDVATITGSALLIKRLQGNPALESQLRAFGFTTVELKRK